MIAPFFGFEAPITVSQMLWVNMIMDTLGGLAFAGEAPQKRIMKEKPKRRDEPILNKYMMHQIFISGGFSVIISLLFLISPSFTSHFRRSENDLVLLSAFFGLFIFLSVMQCINSRTDRLNIFNGITQNRVFILIMALISVIQVSFIYFGGAVLRATPLTVGELIFTLGIAALAIPFELLRKALWRFSGHGEGF
jgi:magnesium-transporting ATPase (P-type)